MRSRPAYILHSASALLLLPVSLLMLSLSAGRAVGQTVAVGDILVVDTNRLILINPSTGERTIISSPSVGSGPTWEDAADVAQDANGDILVVGIHAPRRSCWDGGVFRVNPSTGDRTIISTNDASVCCTSNAASCFGPQAPYLCCTGFFTGDCPGPLGGTECCGAGPYSCCTGQQTGDGTPPCAEVGAGPPLREPYAISTSMSGDIVVVDNATWGSIYTDPRVVRVDPSTGDRTLISSSSIGSGPPLDTVGGITGLTVFQQVAAALVPALSSRGLLALVLLGAGVTLRIRWLRHREGKN